MLFIWFKIINWLLTFNFKLLNSFIFSLTFNPISFPFLIKAFILFICSSIFSFSIIYSLTLVNLESFFKNSFFSSISLISNLTCLICFLILFIKIFSCSSFSKFSLSIILEIILSFSFNSFFFFKFSWFKINNSFLKFLTTFLNWNFSWINNSGSRKDFTWEFFEEKAGKVISVVELE